MRRTADVDHDGTVDEDIRYVYSGNRVIEERDLLDSSTLRREYVYGSYIDEPIWFRFNPPAAPPAAAVIICTGTPNEFLYGQELPKVTRVNEARLREHRLQCLRPVQPEI